jgi:hypothetical protein
VKPRVEPGRERQARHAPSIQERQPVDHIPSLPSPHLPPCAESGSIALVALCYEDPRDVARPLRAERGARDTVPLECLGVAVGARHGQMGPNPLRTELRRGRARRAAPEPPRGRARPRLDRPRPATRPTRTLRPALRPRRRRRR